MNYGGFVRFPAEILQRVGTGEIVQFYRDQHSGSLPMSFQIETFGFRVEMSSHDDEDDINEFVETVEKVYTGRL